MRHALTAAVIALSLSIAVPPSARAAVIMALDLAALVQQSDQIVVAKAATQNARYVDGLIVTDVELQVLSALKGSAQPGSSVIVTHLGGSVGDVELSVAGTAHFVIGQSAIVFLRRAAASGDLNVTGMTQGVMPISGVGAKADVSVSAGSGATLMQHDAKGALVPAPATAPQHRALSAMLADIQQLVAMSN